MNNRFKIKPWNLIAELTDKNVLGLDGMSNKVPRKTSRAIVMNEDEVMTVQKQSSMAIIINLDMMLAKRKMTLSELSERVDISIVNLSILKTGKARAVRLSTLDAICDVLDCQPGDILEFRKEQKMR